MCISVDLPEPDGPITAVSLPDGHVDRDAAKRVDCRVAFAVAPRHVLRDDDLPTPFPFSTCASSSVSASGYCHEPIGSDAAVGVTVPVAGRYPPRRIRFDASASTSPRMPTISSISASPATAAARSGHRVAAVVLAADQAGVEERRREEAAQQRLALVVVEGRPASPCP